MVKTDKEQPASSEVRDRPIKSILKAITWRIIASTTTFLLTFLIFQDDPYATEKATGVACAEAIIKIVLYFLHERAWNSIFWGKMIVSIRRNGLFKSKITKRKVITNKNNQVSK